MTWQKVKIVVQYTVFDPGTPYYGICIIILLLLTFFTKCGYCVVSASASCSQDRSWVQELATRDQLPWTSFLWLFSVFPGIGYKTKSLNTKSWSNSFIKSSSCLISRWFFFQLYGQEGRFSGLVRKVVEWMVWVKQVEPGFVSSLSICGGV
jgi:hypothetical protein